MILLGLINRVVEFIIIGKEFEVVRPEEQDTRSFYAISMYPSGCVEWAARKPNRYINRMPLSFESSVKHEDFELLGIRDAKTLAKRIKVLIIKRRIMSRYSYSWIKDSNNEAPQVLCLTKGVLRRVSKNKVFYQMEFKHFEDGEKLLP